MASIQKRLVSALLAGAASLSFVAPVTLADDYAYVNAEHLNVRSAGSVRGKIVANVDKGYRVTVLETLSNNWKRVLLENGQEGFVNGKYLSEEVPAYEKVASTRYSVKVARAFVRSDGLQRKIAVLNSGDQLEAVSDRVYFGRWVRVRVLDSANDGYEGRVGYISKRLIDPVEGYQFAEETASDALPDAVSAEDDTLDAAPVEPGASESVSSAETTTEDTASTDSGSEDDLAALLNGL